jgi:2-isopropylmalate synthase
MADKVMVFDTTLRDGEQAAGTRLGAREKLELARQLEHLNVDIIEAGFPISSPEDFEAVRIIANEIRTPIICGLTRAVPVDIETCARALEGADKPRIHTGIGVSDIHVMGKFRDEKYGKDLEEKRKRIIEMSVEAVRLSRKYVDDVEFYAEDAGRADETYLFAVLEAAIDAGATVVNIPDTTGYTTPDVFGTLIRRITENVPNVSKATISVHCHNDLGMAVANTIAGVANGARQVEGTINGIGERAGNAALEEVVMGLRTHQKKFQVATSVNTKEFYRTSRMVADYLGFQVPQNKAVVGDNAFRHSSGIHVDGFLKDRETYEIMTPEEVGVPKSNVVLTARTGRHGVRHRLEEIGYRLDDEEMEQVYHRFLAVADKKQEVYDQDLVAIIHDEIHPVDARFVLEYLHTSSGTGTIPTATIRLRIGDEVRSGAECGDGPVDATYHALATMSGMSATLVSYEIRAVTAGTEAMGEVTVRMEAEGESERDVKIRVIGRGASTDIIEASAKAYVDGLNKLAQRIAPTASG